MTRRHTEAELYPLGRPKDYPAIRKASDQYDAGIARLCELEARFGLQVWDRSPTAPETYRAQIDLMEKVLGPAADKAWEQFHTKSLQAMAEPIRGSILVAGGTMRLSALRKFYRPAGVHLGCPYYQAMGRLRHVSTVRILHGRILLARNAYPD
ncbi:MAG: hypothetical protein MUO37_05070 [Methyloceanibacter sp.]|nr:hypothetical protein [Methyloceanibacter sp.]